MTTEQTIKAADNPALANSLINQATAPQTTTTEPAIITHPSDNLVTLPGGYVTAAGEVIKTVEVRELTGRDEELIAKHTNIGRIFSTILSCGTVSIGGLKATDAVLDELLAGDRDAIMLGIYKATYGNTADLLCFCSTCEETRDVQVDVDEDVAIKQLADPVSDRSFTVQGKGHDYKVTLPTGAVQRELATSSDKSYAELTTALLQGTVLEIDGKPIVSKQQVLNLGIQDRKSIVDEIYERNFGPQFNDTTVDCPTCGSKVVVPINLGTLFRF